MSNPSPEPHPENLTPWKPGQSGNPEGYSRRRRLADRIAEAIESEGYGEDLVAAIVAKATGRVDLIRDPETGAVREPSIEWFKTLVQMVDGPSTPSESATTAIGPEVAAAMIAAGLAQSKSDDATKTE